MPDRKGLVFNLERELRGSLILAACGQRPGDTGLARV